MDIRIGLSGFGHEECVLKEIQELSKRFKK